MNISLLENVGVIVPMLNAGKEWKTFYSALSRQGVPPQHILIVNSESTDDTEQLALLAGCQVINIRRADFNHGATRQMSATLLRCEILVFLTQDAILASDDSIQRLVSVFSDGTIGAGYGRQLPQIKATSIERFARMYNYPPVSTIRTLQSASQFGFKAAFASNSFAAYRREALIAVGGFPSNVIVSEETIVFARMLMQGWKTAYVADAIVRHSHSYTVGDELRRYFDIGVLHAQEAWLLDEFGRLHGEGKRFVVSELTFIAKEDPGSLAEVLLRTITKYLGYRLGKSHRLLPGPLCKRLSQQRSYWTK